MVPRGPEPRTLRLLAVRSNQLSYVTLDVCLEVAHLHTYCPFHVHSWHNNHFPLAKTKGFGKGPQACITEV